MCRECGTVILSYLWTSSISPYGYQNGELPLKANLRCQSPSECYYGTGTQKSPWQNYKIFPEAKISLVHGWVKFEKKGQCSNIRCWKWRRWLLGTQMIAKGLIFKCDVSGYLDVILSLNYRIIDPQMNSSAFDQVAGRADEQRKKEKSELQPQIHYANPFASIKIMKVFCHEMQIRWQLGLYTVLSQLRICRIRVRKLYGEVTPRLWKSSVWLIRSGPNLGPTLKLLMYTYLYHYQIIVKHVSEEGKTQVLNQI